MTEGLKDSECKPTDFECVCADTALMAAVETCSMGTCTVVEGLGVSNPPYPLYLLFC